MVILVRSGVEETLRSTCIELAPYAHQVGGHVAVLALDKHTICKPHIDREYRFYKDLPRDLCRFVPKFKGVADVVARQARDGCVNLVAYPYPSTNSTHFEDSAGEKTEERRWNQETLGCCPNSQPRMKITKPQYRVRLSKGGSVSVDHDSDSDELFKDMSMEDGYRRFGCNPWSVRCHRQQIAKMQQEQETDRSHKFVLLENVTDKFHHPCVLDLKIGLRSYGDDATEEKKKSHMAKIQGTTSGKLGVRACGMQIYRPDKGHFICRNKYYGRQLTEEGLRRAVEDFVFNGRELRLDVIAAIVKEIKCLIETLSTLDSYRFFGSSLLLIYEGADESSDSDDDSLFAQKERSSVRRNSHHNHGEQDVTHAATQTDQSFGFDELEMKQVGFRDDSKSSDSAMTSDSETDSSSDDIADDQEAAGGVSDDPSERGNDVKFPYNSLKHSTGWDDSSDRGNARKYQRTNSSSNCHNIPEQEVNRHRKTRRASVEHVCPNGETSHCGGRLAQIRMIDFAHTEYRSKCMAKAETYKGPDTGFMYGLENLLSIFDEILEENDYPHS